MASPERSSRLDPREDRGSTAPPAPPAAITSRAHVDAFLVHLTRFGVKLGLDTISRLLAALGDPHRSFPAVHVAGTNGKGSTVVMLDALLRGLGLRVGRYTSPHMLDFSERIAVQGRPIGDRALVRLAARLANAAADLDPPPTFFEAATALGFAHFAGLDGGGAVDAAVMEVGMGGRFDATNVLAPRVCVITNVALEHTAHLGPTVAAVASEKAGIIKPGTPVVTAAEGEALAMIRDRAAALDAPLYVLGERFALEGDGPFTYQGIRTRYGGLTLGLAGAHQRQNAALALAAWELFLEPAPAPPEAVARRALAGARWPGRLETVRTHPRVLLDCAHNGAAARVLAHHLSSVEPERPLWLVLGVLADKDFEAFLAPLAPLARHVLLTTPDSPRRGDLAAQAAVAARYDIGARTYPSVAAALDVATREAAADGRVCVAGSIYTVAEARAHLRAADRAA